MESAPAEVSTTRLCLATVAVVVLILAVWKVIDFRMQPPPPPSEVSAPAMNP